VETANGTVIDANPYTRAALTIAAMNVMTVICTKISRPGAPAHGTQCPIFGECRAISGGEKALDLPGSQGGRASHRPNAGIVQTHRQDIDAAHGRQRRVEETISKSTVARLPAGLSSLLPRTESMASMRFAYGRPRSGTHGFYL
jgi:hypothetical protein